jgi:hypothetical protein
MGWIVVAIVVVLVSTAAALRRRRHRGTRELDPARVAHQHDSKSIGGFGEHL